MQITLKAARVNAGYTQETAAKTLGVTKDTVRNWERGRHYPNAIQIKKIEAAYGIPFSSIIFLSKDYT